MTQNVDLGGNVLIVEDIKYRATAPGQTGTSLYTDSIPVKRVVYNITADATKTLTAADSGALIYLNKASGSVITLPTNAAGLWFDFAVGTSVTSNAYKVITSAGTQFIKGQLISVDTDSSNALAYDQVGNGSTHVAVNMNGGTTGGLIYTRFRMVCVSSTLWHIEGMNFGSGAVGTPFATS